MPNCFQRIYGNLIKLNFRRGIMIILYFLIIVMIVLVIITGLLTFGYLLSNIIDFIKFIYYLCFTTYTDMEIIKYKTGFYK